MCLPNSKVPIIQNKMFCGQQRSHKSIPNVYVEAMSKGLILLTHLPTYLQATSEANLTGF